LQQSPRAMAERMRLELAERLELVAHGAHDLCGSWDLPMFGWKRARSAGTAHHRYGTERRSRRPGRGCARGVRPWARRLRDAGARFRIHGPRILQRQRARAARDLGRRGTRRASGSCSTRCANGAPAARAASRWARSHRRDGRGLGLCVRFNIPRGNHVSQDREGDDPLTEPTRRWIRASCANGHERPARREGTEATASPPIPWPNKGGM